MFDSPTLIYQENRDGTMITGKSWKPFNMEADMLYTVTSEKELEQACTDLQEAVNKRSFGVMAVHNLKETMTKKGVDFDRECRVFEVCNPHQAKKVLEQQMAISTALPCRISVYRDNDQVTLGTIKPTMMLQMFEAEGLASVAEEVEQVMVESMIEAAKPAR